MKKLIKNKTADVITILEPTAILKLYPINNPKNDENAPIIDDNSTIVFKLLAYKNAVAAGVTNIATIKIVPTLCIAVTDTNVNKNINK